MLFTIGYSNHSIEYFLGLLKRHQIQVIVDVRSQPLSKYNVSFNKNELTKILLNNGFKYVFLGQELGARSEDLSCYENGIALHEKIALTEKFLSGINRLIKGYAKYTICLMCAEKDPIVCHRTILICKTLTEKGIVVSHILENGCLESQKELNERLVKLHKLDQLNLLNLKSPEELIEEAYLMQRKKIQYSITDYGTKIKMLKN